MLRFTERVRTDQANGAGVFSEQSAVPLHQCWLSEARYHFTARTAFTELPISDHQLLYGQGLW